MLSLHRAVARNMVAGDPLPFPWKDLAARATPRRGQVSMLYGPSGSCKSMFALNYLLDLKAPSLYVSPDTDQHDMAIRCMCHSHGMTSTAVEEALEYGALDMNDELTGLAPWLRFSFDPSPTVDDLDLELLAFEEQFGAPPEILVVDTLSDVQAADEDEFRGFRRVMKVLHHFARETNAQVMVLHHTTGEFDGDVSPAPRRAISGKLSKVPSLILSVARNESHFGVAVPKQRQGFSDPSAQSPVWLSIDPARATISDRIETSYTSWTN